MAPVKAKRNPGQIGQFIVLPLLFGRVDQVNLLAADDVQKSSFSPARAEGTVYAAAG